MALVTSSNDNKLKKIIKQHPEFSEFFKEFITATKVSKPKPNPEGYLKGASALGFNPRRCIVFEDSKSGIKAAKAAGCFVVGLTTSTPKEDVEKLADTVVESLADVSYDYIQKCLLPKITN